MKISESSVIFDWGIVLPLTEHFEKLSKDFLITCDILDCKLDDDVLMITDNLDFALSVGNNLNDIIQPFDYDKFAIYNDGIDVKFIGFLNGKQYDYTFRKWKTGITKEEKGLFITNLKGKTLSREIVDKYTENIVPLMLDCLVKD